MFGNMISNMMVRPFQSPLFDSPANYGLDYLGRAPEDLMGWFDKHLLVTEQGT